jgi:general secretion pathway protein D
LLRLPHWHPGARHGLLALPLALLLGCASPVVEQAETLSRQGRYEDALKALDAALQQRPDDPQLRTAHSRQRERLLTQALAQADLALAAGRPEEAARLLERLQQLDPQQARTPRLVASLRAQAQAASQPAATLPAPAPAAAGTAGSTPVLGPAFQRPVSLEFRDAPLRQVFDALARVSSINFVFDREVRADTKVQVLLRNTPLDEALRVILSTQQLAAKVLNENTVLVYPNTAAKQREHLELVTRSLFLRNADVRNVLTMVRTMAKTRDLHADERLNALIVRDTPQAVAFVEALVASIDLPEPEVTLAVEVLEVASDRIEALGLDWPASIEYGLPGGGATVTLSEAGLRGLRGSVLNPALALALRGNTGSTNLLANPTIRARNREKAKVQIGERLPVFTTTAAVNVGVSASVTYLDVGLKLDVEPSVQLDDEVVIKVALEVSNLLREVRGPSGSLAYQIGTRLTTTSLRLKDGETQVLAGLISDEDRQRAEGLPQLAELPLLGRLFGVHSDARTKTEIVMLITPRIVRQLRPAPALAATLAAGTDAQPGQPPLRLREGARAGLALPRAGAAGARAAPPTAGSAPAPAAVPADTLLVDVTRTAAVGDTVSVTLANRSAQAIEGELGWDAERLQHAGGASALGPVQAGRLGFALPAGGSAVYVLRVLPAAAGQSLEVSVSAPLAVEGERQITISAQPPAPAAAPAAETAPAPGPGAATEPAR